MRDLMQGAEGSERPTEAEWNAFVDRAHRSLAWHRAMTVAAVVVVLALGAVGGRALTQATPRPEFGPANNPTETETEDGIVPGPTATETPAPVETEEPAAEETVVVQQWFIQGERLAITHTEVTGAPAVGGASLEALIAGPPNDLRETGYFTAINPDTELLGLTIDDSVATVDLSREFEQSGMGSSMDGIQIGQVVATLLQFDTVERVRFLIEGEEVDYIGGHGVMLDGPQGLQDIDRYLPPVTIETPYFGQDVDATIRVAGTANAYEATINYAITDVDGNELRYRAVDEAGNEVEPGYATATAGTGTRGHYSFRIEVLDDVTMVLIEVWPASGEDGAPRDIASVVVRLRG